MILVDTSIWIDFLRSDNETLRNLLLENRVVTHPFVIAELALGSLKNRQTILSMLDSLPTTTPASIPETRTAIETRSLHARGIGLVDATLITSCLLTPEAKIWTSDKRLRAVATELSLGFLPHRH